jgi:radical SAM protein with 4Fe4S-binding SPASM domain
MELIIKPTSKCNLNCKFCAASELNIQYTPRYVPPQIKDIINVLKPDGIIITGGEPLCCNPEYYEELLTLCDCNIVFTTNLKDFWMKPDKWTPLFNNKRIRVGTSFNYGNTRLWDRRTVYDDVMFKGVINLFKDRVGYAPPFIAVMNEDNEDTYLKHVLLAKELGTYCRLNNALKMGRQGTHYPRYKVFKMWIDIIHMGLGDYEQNCFERSNGMCPINSNNMCESAIRTIYVDVDGDVHYSNCEDKLNLNDGREIPIDITRPIQEPNTIKYDEAISHKCLSCELYNICNGCTTNREAAKKDPEYCLEMLKLKNDIIGLGWRL